MAAPRSIGVTACWAVALASWLAGGAAHAQEADELFEAKIRPVLAGVCLRCHGETKVSGQLRVDSREALLRGGESGPAIVPGKPDESRLLRALRREGDVSAMPPEKDQALRREQIEDFAAWIRAGAPWPAATPKFVAARHWAFEPVRDLPPPPVADAGWCRTSIDPWVRARQEAAKLAPLPAADRAALLRRVTFTLTGLPPTPAELAQFLADRSPQAYERVVERLLASPHYGEHWGRHWLDVVRYADTAGENSDHPLPHAWRYRNWVIAAFQRNQPYDEFLRDQLAGDLLAAEGPPERYAERIVATGFLAIARRFGHEIDKDIHLTIEDSIDTLSKSVLGLTLGCARCHDHKYDPLTARDYYGLYGILASTRLSFPGCEPQQQPRDLVPLLPPGEIAARRQPRQAQAAAVEAALQAVEAELLGLARRVKEQAAAGATILAAGEIDDAGAREFVARSSRRDDAGEAIAVARGDLIQLSLTPRAQHGADTTQVELTIAELGGAERAWRTADLVAGRLPANPQADHLGHAATWFLCDGRDGFALLPERLDGFLGHPELKIWRNGDTPSAFINGHDRELAVWTRLPPRAFFMHPGPQGAVALVWRSPIEGQVRIQGRIADAHPGAGSDGVGFALEKIPATALPDFAATLAKIGELLPKLPALQRERAELRAPLPLPVAFAAQEGVAQNARLHRRGDPADLGDEVPRKFLDVLGGATLQDARQSGRRELAAWLTAPANPLTARVFVNRVWLWHFGRGLVSTPNDFGTRGALPTHPELLDHLASAFVQSGWDVKALHRRIVLSATYQTACETTRDEQSPRRAQLYAAFPRRRLTAEELRDALLAASGELDRTPGEGHPFPPESTWNFTQHAPFAAEYETLQRSVYVMQKRNRRTRYFALFDGADPNASTPQRDVTTVPTQALYFLNDPFIHAQAEKLAARLLSLPDDQARFELAYARLFARSPSNAEIAAGAAFLRDYVDPQPGRAWSAYCRVLLSSNEFLYLD